MINQSARDRILRGMKSRDEPLKPDHVFAMCQLIALRMRDEIGYGGGNGYDTAQLISELIAEVARALKP